MSDRPPPSPDIPRSRRRFQFGLWVWFVATFFLAMALAPVSGLLRGGLAPHGPPPHVFLLLLPATPLARIIHQRW